MQDKFDLQGNPSDVDKIVARQCGRTMSSFSYRLHKKYKELKDTRGEEYARNNPPSYVKPEQWTSLIEKKWSVKKWQAISLSLWGSLIGLLQLNSYLIATIVLIFEIKKPMPLYSS